MSIGQRSRGIQELHAEKSGAGCRKKDLSKDDFDESSRAARLLHRGHRRSGLGAAWQRGQEPAHQECELCRLLRAYLRKRMLAGWPATVEVRTDIGADPRKRPPPQAAALTP